MARRNRRGQSIWEDAAADWDSGLAEFGEDNAAHLAAKWMAKWRLQEHILEPGFTGFISRVVAKTPDEFRAPFFFALRNVIEHWNGPQNMSPLLALPFDAIKFALATFIGQVPNVVDDKIRQGEIDPDNIEIGLSAYLNEAWDRIHSFFNTSNAAKAAALGATVADSHDTHDDKDKKGGAKGTDPKAAAAAAAALDELRFTREQDEKRRQRLVGITPRQVENLALYERILFLHFMRDDGPAPYDAHTIGGLLGYLEFCEGAIKAIPDTVHNDFSNAARALDWFEMRQLELGRGATVMNVEADRLSVFRAEAVLQQALNHFRGFETMLRREAWSRLSTAQWIWLPTRDWCNRQITPRTRAEWRGRFRRLQNSRFWPIAAAVIAAVVVLVPIITTGLSVLFIGWEVIASVIAVLAIIAWAAGGGTVAAWVFTLAVGVVILGRVLATVGDRGFEIVRGVGNFFNPGDGTGLIGGTVDDAGEWVRTKLAGLPARSRTEHADKRLREEAQTDNVAAIKGYVSTITVAASPILVIMTTLFMIYRDFTVLPSLALMILGLAYFAAEMFTRARYVVRDIDDHRLIPAAERRATSLRMIGQASRAVSVLLTFVFVLGIFLGPHGSDKALVVTQSVGEGAVDQFADHHNIAFSAAEAKCYEDREIYERQLPGFLERNPNNYPAKCDGPRK